MEKTQIRKERSREMALSPPPTSEGDAATMTISVSAAERDSPEKFWGSSSSSSSSSSEESDSPDTREMWSPSLSSWEGIESASVWKSKILNLNFEHIGGTLSNSLYKISISDLISSPPKSREWITPTITLDNTEYPGGMTCCEFRDNLYFLGGLWSKKPHPNEYPNQVVIYNPTTKTLSKGTPMKTGKPRPHAFVYSDKLYVFSDGYATGGFHIFEFFDPSSNTWSHIDPPSYVISPPPLLNFHGYTIIDNKLYLATRLRREIVILSFNLDTHQWDPCSSFIKHFFEGRAELVNNMLYGIILDKCVGAYGPVFEEGGLISKKLFHQLATIDCYNDCDSFTSPNPEQPNIPSSSLVHLGEGIFCSVMTCDNLPGPCAHDISISIFQTPADYYFTHHDPYPYPSIPTRLLHTSFHSFPTQDSAFLLNAFLSTTCTGKLEDVPDLHTHQGIGNHRAKIRKVEC